MGRPVSGKSIRYGDEPRARHGDGPQGRRDNVYELFDEGGVVTAGVPVAEPEGGAEDAVRLYLKRIGAVRAPDQGGRGAPGQAGRGERHGGQERPDRGQPAPRGLDRQALHRPRPDPARPDPGGQPGPDPRRREVRLAPRLQVLDLRHLVDPPGHHPRARRPVAHDPHPRAHGRADEPRGRRVAARPAPEERPRADAGGDRRRGRDAARRRSRRSSSWARSRCRSRRRSAAGEEGDARLADFIEDDAHDAPLGGVADGMRERRPRGARCARSSGASGACSSCATASPPESR